MSIDPLTPVELPAFIVVGVPTVLAGVIAALYRRLNGVVDHAAARLERDADEARRERLDREVRH